MKWPRHAGGGHPPSPNPIWSVASALLWNSSIYGWCLQCPQSFTWVSKTRLAPVTLRLLEECAHQFSPAQFRLYHYLITFSNMLLWTPPGQNVLHLHLFACQTRSVGCCSRCPHWPFIDHGTWSVAGVPDAKHVKHLILLFLGILGLQKQDTMAVLSWDYLMKFPKYKNLKTRFHY